MNTFEINRLLLDGTLYLYAISKNQFTAPLGNAPYYGRQEPRRPYPVHRAFSHEGLLRPVPLFPFFALVYTIRS